MSGDLHLAYVCCRKIIFPTFLLHTATDDAVSFLFGLAVSVVQLGDYSDSPGFCPMCQKLTLVVVLLVHRVNGWQLRGKKAKSHRHRRSEPRGEPLS